jgi:methyl-accepting chemotaxis protein
MQTRACWLLVVVLGGCFRTPIDPYCKDASCEEGDSDGGGGDDAGGDNDAGGDDDTMAHSFAVMNLGAWQQIQAEITAAAQEQSSGIEQVNQAVMQMDQVTQQNAALVEEAAAAADSMRQQAQVLARTVSVFKVARGNTLAASPKAAAPSRADEADAEDNAPSQPMERRGPNRAKNVARISRAPKPEAVEPAPATAAKTGTDDDWSEF